jgi:hypothetical protein
MRAGAGSGRLWGLDDPSTRFESTGITSDTAAWRTAKRLRRTEHPLRNEALDSFARHTEAILSRRRTMQGLGLGVLAALVTGLHDALAKNNNKKKKRRKRKKRKNKKEKDSSPPTCAEQCAEGIDNCFERAADSTLCGNNFNTQCTSCSADQDCVGSAFPYCVDEIIVRATGEPSFELIDLCGEFVESVCATVTL